MGGIDPLPIVTFNMKNSLFLILLSLNIISYVKQFINTNTFQDRAEIMFDLVSLIFFIANYVSIIYKAPELFKIIDDFNNIVNDSK